MPPLCRAEADARSPCAAAPSCVSLNNAGLTCQRPWFRWWSLWNEGRHRLDAAAASSPSKSRPKWLRLSEGAVGTLCILEHGRDARLLTARKTTRSECLLGAAFALLAAGVVHINDLFAQSLMHRDVVEVTEGILQFLQSSHETLPSPHSLLAGKRAGKEFRGVPEFLGLNAHLMSTLWVELVELRTRFQNLLPASPELVGSSTDNRLLSQQAAEIVGVARPVAGFDPARSVEDETAKACGFDGRAGAGKRLLTSSLEVLGENRHSRSIRLAIRDRPHNALDEHIKFARRAKFPSDPLELSLHLLRLRINKHVGKQRDRRPQTPKSDPHLVQSLGVPAERGGLIGDELAQARPGNGLKCGLPAVVGRERDWCRLYRLGRLAGDERVPALGLALDRKLNWHFLGEHARELEKLRGFAALEFQFHLAKGRRLATRFDLPLVDGEFDLANSTLDRIDRAAHARLEYRLQAAPQLLAEHGSERGVLRDVEVGLPAADRVLPLVAHK